MQLSSARSLPSLYHLIPHVAAKVTAVREREGGDWCGWWCSGVGDKERERESWETRWERRWERYHLLCCCLLGPSHWPSVIMVLIAEDQCASAWECHVKYGTLHKGNKYVGLGSIWISPPVMGYSLHVSNLLLGKCNWGSLMSVFPTGRFTKVSETYLTSLTGHHVTSSQPEVGRYTMWF